MKGKMSTSGNKGLIWGAWLLSTAGFAILLGGVASLQSVSGWKGLPPGLWRWYGAWR